MQGVDMSGLPVLVRLNNKHPASLPEARPIHNLKKMPLSRLTIQRDFFLIVLVIILGTKRPRAERIPRAVKPDHLSQP